MSKKLLLADDSVVIQKLVGLSFANENVEITYTDNGDDAVTRALEIRPDVVLADVVMPGKNGYEVCEAIKQDPSLAHVPVLLLTGTFEAFDEARAQTAGADGQITKPFEAQALVTRITEVMNNPPAAASEDSNSAAAVVVPSALDEMLPEIDLENSASGFDISTPPAVPADVSFSASSGFAQTESPAPSERLDDTPLIQAEENLSEASDTSAKVFEQPQSFASASPPTSPAYATRSTATQSPPELPPTYVSPPPIASDQQSFDVGRAPEFAAAPVHERSQISAQDVDSALAAGMPDGDATIFVAEEPGEEDANAMTSRTVPATPLTSPLDELTQLAPTAPIDQAQATGDSPADAFAEDVSPEVLYGRRSNDLSMKESAMNETVVTDLDERLAATSLAAGLAGGTVSDAFGPPNPTHSQRAGSPIPSPFGDEAVEPLDTTDSEFLDIGPISQDGNDLDFGFDVSEQQEVTDPGDPLDQSFSSLMDVTDSQILGSPVRPNPLMSDFDVSSSDTGSGLPPSRPAEAEVPEAPSASGRFGTPIEIEEPEEIEEASYEPIGAAVHEIQAAAYVPIADEPSEDIRTPDLSPMMEQRIQEALEKVAWEAFSDLSESIVKQVMTRVESIAWEVIPQMAETLVREEIRQMKDENDD